ncbi:hypothetical protein BGZ46_005350 [Entomortierella lignicola]|nr:hypothetical protein BGZ46_005350 [Entomortierella lignicola]
MTLSQLEAEGYSIFVVRPLSKIEAPPVTTPVVPQNKVEAVSTTNLPTESTTVSSAPAPASSFLSERQEMERIRRQRIEERERVGKQQTSSSSTSPATPAVSDTIDQNSSNKRIRVDPAEETKQPSKDVLVDTSSFLPACEADAMAAAMPLVQSSESKKAEDQTFGGTGYRLGGSPPRSNSGDSSLPPGFSLEDTDLADTEDADWEMMQQAIAMSLQSSK